MPATTVTEAQATRSARTGIGQCECKDEDSMESERNRNDDGNHHQLSAESADGNASWGVP